jgi:hypothetical protein
VPKPKRKISDARKEAEKSKKTTDVIAIEYDPDRGIGIVATLPEFHDYPDIIQLDMLSDAIHTLNAFYLALHEKTFSMDETATRH